MKISAFAAWILAAFCFLLATFGVTVPRVDLTDLGLFFLTVGGLLQYGL